MKIIRHARRSARLPHPVIGLGNFDGVHLGHRTILGRVVEDARTRRGTALAMTFHPHPLTVLRPQQPVALILSLREKLHRIAAVGVDGVILQRFGLDFARQAPERFVRTCLLDTVGVEKILVGHNFSFGRNRAGNAALLADLAKVWGFEVEVIGPVAVRGREVSSTEVRTLLQAGRVGEVAALLGQPYALGGRVVEGFRRGRTIGFPTANLLPRGTVLLPNGVYAVHVEVGGTEYNAVANVGMNPTFGNDRRTIESNIFDFSGDLYGQRIRVSFVEYLREERKFPSVDDLVRQIRTDAGQARRLLTAGEAPTP